MGRREKMKRSRRGTGRKERRCENVIRIGRHELDIKVKVGGKGGDINQGPECECRFA